MVIMLNLVISYAKPGNDSKPLIQDGAKTPWTHDVN